MIGFDPTGSDESSNVAFPPGPTPTTPSTVEPSMNVTEPPTVLPSADVTVAVRTTRPPKTEGFGDVDKLVDVTTRGAALTVCVGRLAELAANAESPP